MTKIILNAEVLSRSEMKNIMAGSEDCPGSFCQCDIVYSCYMSQCSGVSHPQGCMDETEDLWLQCHSDCGTAAIPGRA